MVPPLPETAIVSGLGDRGINIEHLGNKKLYFHPKYRETQKKTGTFEKTRQKLKKSTKKKIIGRN